MSMPDHRAVPAGLYELMQMSLSSLRDTLTSRSHSRDFAYARGDYLRTRVVIVGIVFLLLLPFWTLIDLFMLPEQSIRPALIARLVMLAALVLIVLLAYRSKARLQLARLSAGLVLATPAL